MEALVSYIGAGTVIHHQLLAEQTAHTPGGDAKKDIGIAARRAADDHAHGFDGITLCAHGTA